MTLTNTTVSRPSYGGTLTLHTYAELPDKRIPGTPPVVHVPGYGITYTVGTNR